MPNSTAEQVLRRDTIRQLLAAAPRRRSSRSSRSLPRSAASVATQSSVSRDLKELGAIKTSRGYELPGPGAQ